MSNPTVLVKFASAAPLFNIDLTALLNGRTIDHLIELVALNDDENTLTIGDVVINDTPVVFDDGQVAPVRSVFQLTIGDGTPGMIYELAGQFVMSGGYPDEFRVLLEVL